MQFYPFNYLIFKKKANQRGIQDNKAVTIVVSHHSIQFEVPD